MRNQPAEQHRRRLLFFAIILLAFALRLWDLDARSLWFDEAIEYWVAQPPLPLSIQAIQTGIQDPPFFSILLHGWMSLGAGDFYLRFISVCFSLLSVAAMMRLANRSFGAVAGALGGLTMALLPSEIRYAQEIGQYAPMVCALTLNLIALADLMRKRTWQAYGLWVLTILAGMYSYYGALLPLHVPFGLIVLGDLWRKKKTYLLKDLGASAAYALGLLPLVLVFIPAQLFRNPAVASASKIQFAAPLEELSAFLVGTQHLISFQLSGWPWTNVPELIPTIICAAGLLAALLYALKHPATPQRQFLLWLIVTGVSYYTLIRLHLFSWDAGLYSFRYGMILTPLLIIVMVSGLVKLAEHAWSRPLSAALVLGLIVICVASLPNRHFRDGVYGDTGWIWPETSDIRQITQYWLTHRASTEPTYVYYGAVALFRYYLHINQQDNAQLPPAWFLTCWRQTLVDPCAASGVFYGTWNRELAPEKQAQSLDQTLNARPARLWLIFAHLFPGEDSSLINQLSSRYRIVSSYRLKWDSTYLLEQR